ncbi:anaerobic ribonucleoside-triphosphate reductase activating protein [Candidatus Uhrbacteria bacterium]|nr:anaerobic ribonucleoside-triphosphate reductase activating protein [Candidatus Uhrbacteria bacterium]
MIISGFQPLSLLDYPGIVCSIIFTQGCPFRCGYCHNPELIPLKAPDITTYLKQEVILEHLHRRKHIVEGVCITGGEPTIHHDLPDFILKVKRLGLLVKLDTNGISPRVVELLIKEKMVDFFAMDIKHTWERYSEVIGIRQKHVVDNCRETFNLIQNSTIPHEFRTTVYSGFHEKEDLDLIVDQLNVGEHYALQSIRYDKMFQQNLPQKKQLDLEHIANEMRARRPDLTIEIRT